MQSKINLNVTELNNTLKNGGVIGFVTDTVWGLGCLPDNRQGIDKIYEIKGRDRSKPLILMSCELKHLQPYIMPLNEKSKKLAEKYFPGALTIISEKSEKTPDFCTAGKNTVGVRVPDNFFFKTLCEAVDGHVLATTSANLSEHTSSKTFEEAQFSVGNAVDILYEDFGFKCAGKESTVVLTLNDNIKILRQGAIILTD